jgi:hypothetical protein
MKNTSHLLRKAYIDLLTPFVIESVTIPIMDGSVNPAVTIPKYRGAETYIILLDQSDVETSNNDCSQRTTSVIGLDIVTKYPLNVGNSLSCELISNQILQAVNPKNGQPIQINELGIQVLGTTVIINRMLPPENGGNLTAFRKRLTFSHSILQS